MDLKQRTKSADAVAIVSYDEKPGVQAIGVTAPDLPPVPGIHPTVARDHEYKRHGTVSLLAGIDLLTGKVHALVKDRHRSREFIEFLKLLDMAYPTHTAIKVILDNHSARISKETRGWLAAQRSGRFEFVFTPPSLPPISSKRFTCVSLSASVERNQPRYIAVQPADAYEAAWAELLQLPAKARDMGLAAQRRPITTCLALAPKVYSSPCKQGLHGYGDCCTPAGWPTVRSRCGDFSRAGRGWPCCLPARSQSAYRRSSVVLRSAGCAQFQCGHAGCHDTGVSGNSLVGKRSGATRRWCRSAVRPDLCLYAGCFGG